jgi:hypothetical protein
MGGFLKKTKVSVTLSSFYLYWNSTLSKDTFLATVPEKHVLQQYIHVARA